MQPSQHYPAQTNHKALTKTDQEKTKHLTATPPRPQHPRALAEASRSSSLQSRRGRGRKETLEPSPESGDVRPAKGGIKDWIFGGKAKKSSDFRGFGICNTAPEIWPPFLVADKLGIRGSRLIFRFLFFSRDNRLRELNVRHLTPLIFFIYILKQSRY